VTPRIFEDVIEPAILTHHVITTYGASNDLALWISTIKNHQERVGRVGVNARVPECVDTVDVSAVAKAGLAHSTWAESHALSTGPRPAPCLAAADLGSAGRRAGRAE
jgi:hypothetical protein